MAMSPGKNTRRHAISGKLNRPSVDRRCLLSDLLKSTLIFHRRQCQFWCQPQISIIGKLGLDRFFKLRHLSSNQTSLSLLPSGFSNHESTTFLSSTTIGRLDMTQCSANHKMFHRINLATSTTINNLKFTFRKIKQMINF